MSMPGPGNLGCSGGQVRRPLLDTWEGQVKAGTY